MKKLDSFNVKDLSYQELKSINGGDWFLQNLGKSLGIIVGVTVNVIDFVKDLPSNIAMEVSTIKANIDDRIEIIAHR